MDRALAREAAWRLQSLQESCFFATSEQTATAIKANDRAMHRYNRHKLKPFQAALRRSASASHTTASQHSNSQAATSTAFPHTPETNAPAPEACGNAQPLPRLIAAPGPDSQQPPRRAIIPEARSQASAQAATAECPRAAATTSPAATPGPPGSSPVSPAWSQQDLQEIRRRGLDPEMIGQQLQVRLLARAAGTTTPPPPPQLALRCLLEPEARLQHQGSPQPHSPQHHSSV